MKSIKKFLSLLSFTVIGFYLISCSCSNCQKQEEAVIPLHILKKANAFIVSKTGEEFFSAYISPDFTRTKHTTPYYEMVYHLYMPEKPYVNSRITFTIDSLGAIIRNRDIIGIPNCADFPTQCNWQIDKEGAVAIAEKYGLEKGIKDWQVGFIWNPERQIYVWHIISTIREMEGEYGYRASGKELIIDPVNGNTLALNDWHIR